MATSLDLSSLYGFGLFNGFLPEGDLTIAQTRNSSQTAQTINNQAVIPTQTIVPATQNTVNSQGISNPIPTNSNSNKAVPKADLVGQISSIEIPDTIEFGDNGKVKVTVTNRGNGVAKGPLSIKLYISTDGDIDVNDGLLTTMVKNINLKPGQSRTFSLDYKNLTSVIAPGAYKIIAQIDSGNAIAESNENNNIVSKHLSAPGSDVVIDWNATALNAIQAEGEAGRGVPPTDGSGLLAMVSAAVYDAVNAFDGTHTSYSFNGAAPVGASIQAAAVGAAHRVLVELLPKQAAMFDQQLVRSLIEVTDNPFAEAKGVLFGRQVAEQILALRKNDGSSNNAPIVYPPGDYVWRPAAAGEPNAGVAIGPNWGKVTPFAIPGVANFAPDGLDGKPGTSQYIEEIEEVRLFGGKESTALSPVLRSADQTEIAVFWAYDRADTFRPYGQLNQIAEEVAVREGNTLSENARLFAQLNIALADAAIVAWDAKYKVMQPRPDDVIAEGFAANDGIEATVPDPDWQPLLAPTPPFPDYISGHSSFGGAWAGVMTNFFGEDYQFTAVSQELSGTTRHYDSFYDAAFDDAISRVYGGIHVREATVTDALPMGLAVGNFVAENLFVPIPNLA